MGPEALREVKHIADLSRAYRPHVHDEVSLAHVWRGSTLARIGDREVPVSGECLVVIPPGVVHACNPVAGSGWEYTLALLDPRACPEAVFAAPCRVLPSAEGLEEAFRALRGGDGTVIPVILAHLERVLPVPESGRAVPPARALGRVMDLLRSHPGEPLSLERLCQVAGLSRYHLVRSFKEAYGLTPHAYHLNLRISAAKERLRKGQDLAAVALESGFCDQSHFSRVFSSRVGMTPAAYQKATAIPSKMRTRRRS